MFDGNLRAMADEQFKKKNMVKTDVTDFGFGKEHFNEYLVYKKGGKKKLYLILTNLFIFLQRMEQNWIIGLWMNSGTS